MSLDTILADLSFDAARAHLDWLFEHAPERISGTPDQERAAEYFVDRLTTFGLDARLETFTAYRSVPTRGSLRVIAPETGARDVPCEPCGHIVSTPDEGVEVDLHYLGGGSEADYAGRDVRGAAVLTEIAEGPSRPEKAAIAARHGARVIVFANWGLPEFDTIPCGAIKCVWGNPTRRSMAEIPQIAALGIGRADGDALIAAIDAGPVRVRVVAQATRDWGPLTQPTARLRSPNNPSGQFVIVGGHHDAWRPGMTDNAAGNALTLELARALGAHRDLLDRDVVFAFWNGHEIGDYEGSTWFVDRHWDDIDALAVAYLNVDSVGFAHTSFFLGDSTPELQRFHQRVERRLLGEATDHRHLTRDNEHPFFGVGVPALEARYHFSPEQVAAWGGARGGWWWHSRADTIDKIDPERFRSTMAVYAGYVWELCTSPVLPMDFTTYADRIHAAVDRMQRIAGPRLSLDLPVDRFVAAARRLETAAGVAAQDADARRRRRLNEAMMRISRLLLPAFETAGGRWAQDIVGHPALASDVPALHAVHELARTPDEDEVAHLLRTELVRERNRLSDALRGASDVIRQAIE